MNYMDVYMCARVCVCLDVHNMHFIERVQVEIKKRKCQSKSIYKEEKSDNISYHQAFISYMSCINLHDISLAQEKMGEYEEQDGRVRSKLSRFPSSFQKMGEKYTV